MPKRLASLTGVFILLAALLYANGPQLTATPPTTYAQSASCDPLVQEAMQKVANTCLDLGRNEICYGYDNISAILRDPSLTFASAGDIIPVDQVETLITRPIDTSTGEWGIAMMRLQADIPDNSDGFVTLLVFGGTEINNQVQLASNNVTCQATNNTSDNLNVRSGPGTNFPDVDIFDSGATLAVDGRNEAGDWLHTPSGWVSAGLVTTSCDASQLALVSTADPASAPMQSFTLRMDEEAQCQAIPTGMMVQTESGQTATVMVNNVQLQLGSTAHIRTSGPNGNMVITNVQGHVQVTSGGKTVEVGDGEETTVPFEDGETAEPEDPTPSDDDLFSEDLFLMDGILDTSEWDFFNLLGCNDEFTESCVDAALYTCQGSWSPDCADYYGEISQLCEGDSSDFCANWEDTFASDTDFDGVGDDADACPAEFGLGADGCPTGEEFGHPPTDGPDVENDPNEAPEAPTDRDGDGVTDAFDACPSEYGATPDGCPEALDTPPDAPDAPPDPPSGE